VFERFSDEARRVVIAAQQEARSLGAEQIAPVHLLLALTRDPGAGGAALAAAGIDHPQLSAALARSGTALDADALAAVGIDLTQVRAATEATFGPGALDGVGARTPSGHIRFAESSKQAVALAVRLVGRRKRRAIDSGSVLFGVLSARDPVVGRVLRQLGADPAVLRERAAGTDAA